MPSGSRLAGKDAAALRDGRWRLGGIYAGVEVARECWTVGQREGRLLGTIWRYLVRGRWAVNVRVRCVDTMGGKIQEVALWHLPLAL